MTNYPSIINYFLLIVILIIFTYLIGYSFFKKNYKLFYFILFVISLIPKLLFLLSSKYDAQGLYDIDAHIFYIKYIASNFSLPLPENCFECYQQPIYYITAAVIYRLAQIIGFVTQDSLINILQLYSLFIYHLFLFAGILIINLIVRERKSAIIATSLLLFWPSGVFQSIRISNDILIYLTTTLSLYFLIRWWIKTEDSSLIKSISSTLLGLLIKTNAIIMVPIIILSYLIKTHNLKKSIRFLSILLFLVVIVMVVNQRNTLSGNKQDDWLVGDFRKLPESAYVENNLTNYVGFDIISYLKYPNIRTRDDLGGRQYFWVYLLKTSLFGEFVINHPIQSNVARVLSFLFLGLLFSLFVRLIRLKRAEIIFNIPILLSLFFFLSSIIYLRIIHPCSCSNDFRFIYPALIPMVTVIAQCYKVVYKNNFTKYAYLILIFFFIGLSFLYQIIPIITP